MPKICCVCKQIKKLKEFNKRGDRYKTPKYFCKKCEAEYVKKYNEKHKIENRIYRRIRKNKIKEWFLELKDRPCTDCGGLFPSCCMDFDHKNPEKKKATLATLVGEGYSKETILKEIKKCDLVCANCHRIRTQKRGWNQWKECRKRI